MTLIFVFIAVCSTNQYRCDNGECIAQKFVCDYYAGDCIDYSDERNCAYPAGKFCALLQTHVTER